MSIQKRIICDICGDVKTDIHSDWGRVTQLCYIFRSKHVDICGFNINNIQHYNNVHICDKCLLNIINNAIKGAFIEQDLKQNILEKFKELNNG